MCNPTCLQHFVLHAVSLIAHGILAYEPAFFVKNQANKQPDTIAKLEPGDLEKISKHEALDKQ